MWDSGNPPTATQPPASTGSSSSSLPEETARSWSCADCGTVVTHWTDVLGDTTSMWLQLSLLRSPCGPCWRAFCFR